MEKHSLEMSNLEMNSPVGGVLSELTDTEMETVAGGATAQGFTDGNCLKSITADCTPWLGLC
ncbi:hypothetical protein [Saccharibacillus kuerlensis]|uniref:Lantibiotic n=1 Tax=Saccharibacillus kuerlensis TaxID=459527 RepID=A0ABQ2L6T9_9BACL|nr:hypothetical protein [Saccharibacillus kuerlensis]GGO04986.1 hypothetical protein GCM10010969_30880 [Saccharibacillus kuerlensis]